MVSDRLSSLNVGGGGRSRSWKRSRSSLLARQNLAQSAPIASQLAQLARLGILADYESSDLYEAEPIS